MTPRRHHLPALALLWVATSAAAAAAGGLVQRPAPPAAAPAAPVETTHPLNHVGSVTLIPGAPQPDQPFEIRVDGQGTCKLWLSVLPLGAGSSVPGFDPGALAYDLTRPADGEFTLPVNLPGARLPAGQYKLRVDAHEGLGGNCTGYFALELQVGPPPPTPPPTIAKQPGALPSVKPAPSDTSPLPKLSQPTQPTPPQGQASTQRLTGVALIPDAPRPDRPIRVRVDGAGTCKLWFHVAKLEQSSFPKPYEWNPIPTINEVTRPADAEVQLPGELAPLKLGAGRYKLAVSAHDGLAGSTCKGAAALEFEVGLPKPAKQWP